MTSHEIESIRRFYSLLPKTDDLELVVLKAHLLLEEQLFALVFERVKNEKSIKDAKLGFNQILKVAKSFFDVEQEPYIWKSLERLNSIRNKISHRLEPRDLELKLEEFIQGYPSGLVDESENIESNLGLTLASLFVSLSSLVKYEDSNVIR